MQQVTAYEDDQGRLHKTRRDAIHSDFITKLQEVWGGMPDCRDRGDPVVIARIISGSTYPMVRKNLMEALLWLEEQLGSEH